MSDKLNLVILTYESHQANAMTQRLLTEFPGQVKGIVASEVIVAGKNTWQSLRFLLQRTGLGFVGMKGTEIIVNRLAGLLNKTSIPSLAKLAAQHDVPLIGAKKVNAPEIRDQIEAWQPDLIISVYLNQLIGKKLIALPAQGVINVHPALLPKNRGLFPYFWALANGDTETGVTVHWVEPKFDTGAILRQQTIPINPDDTVISLARMSAWVGADLLVEAVRLIEAGDAPALPQDNREASYFSWPTAADVSRFRRQGRHYGSISEMWRDLTT